MKPFIKWVGGKARLVKQLRVLMGRCTGTYYEPFLGGGAVLLARLEEGEVSKAYASDTNLGLIVAWQMVQTAPGELHELLERFPTTDFRDAYYQHRLAYNEGIEDTLERAATFIWLNKACFNGLWRENSKGEMNAPVGSYKEVKLPSLSHLEAVSRLIQPVKFRSRDFLGTIEKAGEGDQVYCDPPYVPVVDGGFESGYGTEWDGDSDQRRLASAARWAAERGAKVFLTNHDTHHVRNVLYPHRKGFRHYAAEKVGRTVSAGQRKPVAEIIATIG